MFKYPSCGALIYMGLFSFRTIAQLVFPLIHETRLAPGAHMLLRKTGKIKLYRKRMTGGAAADKGKRF